MTKQVSDTVSCSLWLVLLQSLPMSTAVQVWDSDPVVKHIWCGFDSHFRDCVLVEKSQTHSMHFDSHFRDYDPADKSKTHFVHFDSRFRDCDSADKSHFQTHAMQFWQPFQRLWPGRQVSDTFHAVLTAISEIVTRWTSLKHHFVLILIRSKQKKVQMNTYLTNICNHLSVV